MFARLILFDPKVSNIRKAESIVRKRLDLWKLGNFDRRACRYEEHTDIGSSMESGKPQKPSTSLCYMVRKCICDYKVRSTSTMCFTEASV